MHVSNGTLQETWKLTRKNIVNEFIIKYIKVLIIKVLRYVK